MTIFDITIPCKALHWPPPLDSPREPNLEYLNMTVDEVANEDGIEHFDLAKDAYRRTDSSSQESSKRPEEGGRRNIPMSRRW